MRRKKLFPMLFLFFIFTFFLIPNVFSIGVSCGVPDHIKYEPFKKIPFEFYILRAYNGYTYSYEGTFKDYISIEEETPDYVKGYLVLPPSFNNPGAHLMRFTFVEKAKNSNANAVAVTAIRCPFYVDVPYPGKYLVFNFNVNNVNIGENTNLSYHLENRGKETIKNLKLYFKILKNNKTLDEYNVTIKELNGTDSLNKKLILNSKNLKPGYYDVLGFAVYEDENLSLLKKFRVGELDVNLLNVTNKVLQNNFLKINFTVENNWNKEIKNVYIVYNIKNDIMNFKKAKTISIDLKPFEVKTFEQIYEAQGILPGDYFIHYELYFSDNKKEGVFPLKVIKPKTNSYTLIITFSLLFLTIIIFLLTLLLRRKRIHKRINKRKKKQK